MTRNRGTLLRVAIVGLVVATAAIADCCDGYATPGPPQPFISSASPTAKPPMPQRKTFPSPPSTPAAALATPSTPTGPAASTGGTDTPTTIAVAWLVAYRQTDYTRPATAWIAAVAPYVTPDMDRANQRLATTNTDGGAAWHDYVQHHCRTTVLQPAAIIPPEAPHTHDLVHVQVSATLSTTCDHPTTAPVDENVAVTLAVARTPIGWRIDRREY